MKHQSQEHKEKDYTLICLSEYIRKINKSQKQENRKLMFSAQSSLNNSPADKIYDDDIYHFKVKNYLRNKEIFGDKFSTVYGDGQ